MPPSAFPSLSWTQTPLILNAPMGGFAGPDLAAAVSLAGGLGMIGSLFDETALEAQLSKAQDLLRTGGLAAAGSGSTNGANGTGSEDEQLLPIGVGLLLFALAGDKKRRTFLSLLAKYRPAVIWLFAEPTLEDFATWTSAVRSTPGLERTQVWIQTCTVTSALKLAQSNSPPDVLVLQGVDAGGHGYANTSSIISLVPETLAALANAGKQHIPVIAAGGIVHAESAAAALVLGASGVVMGTRFLASHEVKLPHPGYREQILNATDGGQATAKHTVFDDLQERNLWPAHYDGRAVRSVTWREHVKENVAIEEVRKRYKDVVEGGEGQGWSGGEEDRRAAVWAGTGVGMVGKVMGAGEIVREVRDGVRGALEGARARL